MPSFGGALGIAVLGSIGTAVYRSQVAETVPARVPSQAAAARDTLGGAVAGAGQLPEQLGAALLDAAREAFTQGLQVTAAISAAVAVGVAILAAVVLRHVEAGAEPQGSPDPSPGGPCAGKVGVVKVSKAALPGRDQGREARPSAPRRG